MKKAYNIVEGQGAKEMVGRQPMANSWIKYYSGVASFTQIRMCASNLLRTASSIPLWVHGVISAAKLK